MVVIGLILVALFSLLLVAFTCLLCFKPPVSETIAVTNDPMMKAMAAAQTTATTVTASSAREDAQQQQKVRAVKTKVMMAKTPTGKGKGGGPLKEASSSSAAAVSKQAAVARKSSSRMSKHKRGKAMPADMGGKQRQLNKLKAKSTQMGSRKKRRG